MKTTFLEFEQPIAELESKIEELRFVQDDSAVDISEEISRLQKKSQALTRDIYAKLSAWQIALVARHPQRPYTLDYINGLFTGFEELHGDRGFADDPAIVGGLARFNGEPCMIIGHQKGRDTKQKIYRNFGMPKPEGYRKALRVMRMAEKFRMPIVTSVDTPGAYPGLDAEERGQAEAIAYNLREMARLPTPVVVNVTGEGGSGGALAIAVGDRVNMLEHSVYSVISPEGCASILWRDAARAEEAATAMKITAADLKSLGIVDEIIPEPAGGAHVDHDALFRTLDVVIEAQLKELSALTPAALVAARYDKFRNMGRLGQDFLEEASYTQPEFIRTPLDDQAADEAEAETETEA